MTAPGGTTVGNNYNTIVYASVETFGMAARRASNVAADAAARCFEAGDERGAMEFAEMADMLAVVSYFVEPEPAIEVFTYPAITCSDVGWVRV